MQLGVRERWAAGLVAAVAVVGTWGGWLYSRQRTREAAPLVPVVASPSPEAQSVQGADSADSGVETFPAGGGVSPEPAPSPTAPVASPEAVPSPSPSPLMVYVTGAVKRPGVYGMRPGSRIFQAIHAAGGFKPNARQDALNLVDAVRDADHIHIPVKPTPTPRAAAVRVPTAAARPVVVSGTSPGKNPSIAPTPEPPRGRVLGREPETQSPTLAVSSEGGTVAESGESRKSGKLKVPGEGTVNINTASAEELQRLPGVGPAMSQRILEYRQQIGRFADPSQLQDVKGIGPKTFAKMQPFVTVD